MTPDPSRDRDPLAEGGHREPCPAELKLAIPEWRWASGSVPCQRPLERQGDRSAAHREHHWVGKIDGRLARITWWDEP